MPFPNKGQNHNNGIKNEKEIVNHFNDTQIILLPSIWKKIYAPIISWGHEGGTQQKKDASSS